MINASNAAGREILACSLVIPIFNEEAVLPRLIQRIVVLLDTLDASAEAIFGAALWCPSSIMSPLGAGCSAVFRLRSINVPVDGGRSLGFARLSMAPLPVAHSTTAFHHHRRRADRQPDGDV